MRTSSSPVRSSTDLVDVRARRSRCRSPRQKHAPDRRARRRPRPGQPITSRTAG
jgi:hypothetical protein